MDVLLSIPILSVLVRPSVSTSVNLLFFYATWSTLVLSHDPISIHATSLLVLRVVFWLAPSLLFLAFDSLVPSLAAGIKFAGKVTRPPRPDRLVGLALLNMILVTLVESVLSYIFYAVTGTTFFRMNTTLPFPWQIFKHHCVLFTSREVITYYLHRMLLHAGGRNPPALTRWHTTFAHGGPTTPLQLYTDHPVPLLLLQLVPVLLPSAVIRPHMITYLFFLGLCTVEATFVTSGYSIVPGVILGGNARRNAAHYASGGRANFGAWGILDWAHGTSKGGDVVEDIRDEADKHNLKERSAAKADDGASILQDGVDALKNGATRRSPRIRSSKGH
ncbi:Methylsterol monooxygenase-like protein [Hapsidospora chrysogenum ATCC 11550]|uniref:Methylsterol monooxygenase-like protein n=1 Tax=Hapsidospora chrysogenum (strain ATCC 11550 / CBS 779.69 / DSM 880 / IAM 14645 / JCM 23072 / IMI 49137) TaxID=857340 RepID=A0A086T4M3_HAPC1|nr:Methylsterol monooxygenase-like protein [Hapsidospora chrysogenum ATCC 11550]